MQLFATEEISMWQVTTKGRVGDVWATVVALETGEHEEPVTIGPFPSHGMARATVIEAADRLGVHHADIEFEVG